MNVSNRGKKKVLVVIRRSPYGSSLAKASVDVALAMAAFEQAVDVLFMGEGVLQLVPDQDSRSLGLKNIERQLASLPLYDVNQIYVDAEAAARYNLDTQNQKLDAQVLAPLELHQLMVDYDHLLGF
jgi:tRNA 2-thiouridine synthesizing protein C